ncbi:MAG TPA: LPS export ABC transporter periplasmic protein LptC [Thermoanaerobaculia bacterium]|nr:LPS export ABC transporter periplasmic protein LptC [Thermoanaerobaculia bacterium]
MTRTVRILRIALPIAFVAFIVLLVVSWDRSTARRNSAGAEPVTSTQRPKDRPLGEAIAFEDVQTIGGRIVARIRAQRVVGFASGWSTLEGVQLTIYRANGLTYELTSPLAQYNSETKEAEVKGGVRVTSNDGVDIQTAEMHFDGSRLTNRIPVQFTIDRWSGKGGALDMNVAAETVRLHQKVSATLAPAQPSEPPLTIAGAEAVFRRMENDVTFTGGVLADRGPDQLRADRILGRFTADRSKLLGLEGHQNIEIIMAGNPAPGENLGGRKRITGNRFFTEFTGEGEVVAINVAGDGQLVHATLDGPPRREIDAGHFRVGVAQRAVSEVKAEGQVVMKEPAEKREIRVDRATVSFDGATHRASTAFLDGNFKYRDPKTTASSIRAHYDIAGDRILLTASPGFDPTVVSDGQTLKAKQIEFAPKAGTSMATGEVIAELVSKQGGPSADATNLFPAGKPVFVNSDVLVMRQSNKTASFSGNVRAWQDTNTLFASELQVEGTGQTITARGNVRTVLYNVEAQPRKIPVRSKSEQLVARRNERQLQLLGEVVIEDESRTVTADKATLFFDAQRKLERVEAQDKVVLVEKATNRKGTGDRAIYQIKEKMAHLHGSPATASEPQGTLSGQHIVFDMNRNRVQVLSPTGETQGTFKQQ